MNQQDIFSVVRLLGGTKSDITVSGVLQGTSGPRGKRAPSTADSSLLLTTLRPTKQWSFYPKTKHNK